MAEKVEKTTKVEEEKPPEPARVEPEVKPPAKDTTLIGILSEPAQVDKDAAAGQSDKKDESGKRYYCNFSDAMNGYRAALNGAGVAKAAELSKLSTEELANRLKGKFVVDCSNTSKVVDDQAEAVPADTSEPREQAGEVDPSQKKVRKWFKILDRQEKLRAAARTEDTPDETVDGGGYDGAGPDASTMTRGARPGSKAAGAYAERSLAVAPSNQELSAPGDQGAKKESEEEAQSPAEKHQQEEKFALFQSRSNDFTLASTWSEEQRQEWFKKNEKDKPNLKEEYERFKRLTDVGFYSHISERQEKLWRKSANPETKPDSGEINPEGKDWVAQRKAAFEAAIAGKSESDQALKRGDFRVMDRIDPRDFKFAYEMLSDEEKAAYKDYNAVKKAVAAADNGDYSELAGLYPGNKTFSLWLNGASDEARKSYAEAVVKLQTESSPDSVRHWFALASEGSEAAKTPETAKRLVFESLKTSSTETQEKWWRLNANPDATPENPLSKTQLEFLRVSEGHASKLVEQRGEAFKFEQPYRAMSSPELMKLGDFQKFQNEMLGLSAADKDAMVKRLETQLSAGDKVHFDGLEPAMKVIAAALTDRSAPGKDLRERIENYKNWVVNHQAGFEAHIERMDGSKFRDWLANASPEQWGRANDYIAAKKAGDYSFVNVDNFEEFQKIASPSDQIRQGEHRERIKNGDWTVQLLDLQGSNRDNIFNPARYSAEEREQFEDAWLRHKNEDLSAIARKSAEEQNKWRFKTKPDNRDLLDQFEANIQSGNFAFVENYLQEKYTVELRKEAGLAWEAEKTDADKAMTPADLEKKRQAYVENFLKTRIEESTKTGARESWLNRAREAWIKQNEKMTIAGKTLGPGDLDGKYKAYLQELHMFKQHADEFRSLDKLSLEERNKKVEEWTETDKKKAYADWQVNMLLGNFSWIDRLPKREQTELLKSYIKNPELKDEKRAYANYRNRIENGDYRHIYLLDQNRYDEWKLRASAKEKDAFLDYVNQVNAGAFGVVDRLSESARKDWQETLEKLKSMPGLTKEQSRLLRDLKDGREVYEKRIKAGDASMYDKLNNRNWARVVSSGTEQEWIAIKAYKEADKNIHLIADSLRKQRGDGEKPGDGAAKLEDGAATPEFDAWWATRTDQEKRNYASYRKFDKNLSIEELDKKVKEPFETQKYNPEEKIDVSKADSLRDKEGAVTTAFQEWWAKRNEQEKRSYADYRKFDKSLSIEELDKAVKEPFKPEKKAPKDAYTDFMDAFRKAKTDEERTQIMKDMSVENRQAVGVYLSSTTSEDRHRFMRQIQGPVTVKRDVVAASFIRDLKITDKRIISQALAGVEGGLVPSERSFGPGGKKEDKAALPGYQGLASRGVSDAEAQALKKPNQWRQQFGKPQEIDVPKAPNPKVEEVKGPIRPTAGAVPIVFKDSGGETLQKSTGFTLGHKGPVSDPLAGEKDKSTLVSPVLDKASPTAVSVADRLLNETARTVVFREPGAPVERKDPSVWHGTPDSYKPGATITIDDGGIKKSVKYNGWELSIPSLAATKNAINGMVVHASETPATFVHRAEEAVKNYVKEHPHELIKVSLDAPTYSKPASNGCESISKCGKQAEAVLSPASGVDNEIRHSVELVKGSDAGLIKQVLSLSAANYATLLRATQSESEAVSLSKFLSDHAGDAAIKSRGDLLGGGNFSARQIAAIEMLSQGRIVSLSEFTAGVRRSELSHLPGVLRVEGTSPKILIEAGKGFSAEGQSIHTLPDARQQIRGIAGDIISGKLIDLPPGSIVGGKLDPRLLEGAKVTEQGPRAIDGIRIIDGVRFVEGGKAGDQKAIFDLTGRGLETKFILDAQGRPVRIIMPEARSDANQPGQRVIGPGEIKGIELSGILRGRGIDRALATGESGVRVTGSQTQQIPGGSWIVLAGPKGELTSKGERQSEAGSVRGERGGAGSSSTGSSSKGQGTGTVKQTNDQAVPGGGASVPLQPMTLPGVQISGQDPGGQDPSLAKDPKDPKSKKEPNDPDPVPDPAQSQAQTVTTGEDKKVDAGTKDAGTKETQAPNKENKGIDTPVPDAAGLRLDLKQDTQIERAQETRQSDVGAGTQGTTPTWPNTETKPWQDVPPVKTEAKPEDFHPDLSHGPIEPVINTMPAEFINQKHFEPEPDPNPIHKEAKPYILPPEPAYKETEVPYATETQRGFPVIPNQQTNTNEDRRVDLIEKNGAETSPGNLPTTVAGQVSSQIENALEQVIDAGSRPAELADVQEILTQCLPPQENTAADSASGDQFNSAFAFVDKLVQEIKAQEIEPEIMAGIGAVSELVDAIADPNSATSQNFKIEDFGADVLRGVFAEKPDPANALDPGSTLPAPEAAEFVHDAEQLISQLAGKENTSITHGIERILQERELEAERLERDKERQEKEQARLREEEAKRAAALYDKLKTIPAAKASKPDSERKDKGAEKGKEKGLDLRQRQTHVVALGDTLESIAAKRLNNKKLAPLIFQLNRTKIPVKRKDGKMFLQLKPRTTLLMPSQAEMVIYLAAERKPVKFEYEQQEDNGSLLQLLSKKKS